MKGTIISCLEELVIERFGREAWEKTLVAAGFDSSTIFLPIQNIDDKTVIRLITAFGHQFDLTMTQVADAFGDYWVNTYSQRLFSHYYADCPTAREFLLKMDMIHVAMTRNGRDAKPPRFEYEWQDDDTLLMRYKSNRALIEFAMGLVKGVGIFYKEPLTVTKVGDDTIKIVFFKN